MKNLKNLMKKYALMTSIFAGITAMVANCTPVHNSSSVDGTFVLNKAGDHPDTYLGNVAGTESMTKALYTGGCNTMDFYSRDVATQVETLFPRTTAFTAGFDLSDKTTLTISDKDGTLTTKTEGFTDYDCGGTVKSDTPTVEITETFTKVKTEMEVSYLVFTNPALSTTLAAGAAIPGGGTATGTEPKTEEIGTDPMDVQEIEIGDTTKYLITCHTLACQTVAQNFFKVQSNLDTGAIPTSCSDLGTAFAVDTATDVTACETDIKSTVTSTATPAQGPLVDIYYDAAKKRLYMNAATENNFDVAGNELDRMDVKTFYEKQ
ncbi:MAG: hypothetical protein OEV66_04000 [Spirochaetia bacterium]|nr:hypothetical protein [Spirochaetia bacterium]